MDSWQETSGGHEATAEMQIPDPDDDSLQEHLLWQINLGRFSETDTAIATAIVFALDEDGFPSGFNRRHSRQPGP